MNTCAAALVLLWLAGWSLAMVRAGMKARAETTARTSRERLPGRSAVIPG